MRSVTALYRYPLKSAGGEPLEEVAIDHGGPVGDRQWACLDLADATVGSAKHPRRWGRLLEVAARTEPPARGATSGRVVVQVADDAWVAGSEDADRALSAHLGRPVRLIREVPHRVRLHRLLPAQAGLVPDWMTGGPGDHLVTDVAGAHPGGRFVDFASVHLVTTGGLRGLARRLGRPCVDARRFRPNIVLDAAADPAPGSVLGVGSARLRVVLPTPRCIVPGLDPHGVAAPDAEADDRLLGELARGYRATVPGRGRAACFGVYAEVLDAGTVAVGDAVTVA